MARTRRNPTIDHSRYYAPDSAARQVAPQPDLPPIRRRRLKRRKVKPEFAYDIQARHRQNFMSYVVVFAFFGCLALILALNAHAEHGRAQLEAARGQLAALQSANAARASEIYSNLNLSEIERVAIEELGMIPPEEFQIIDIRVSPQSFFAHADTEVPTQNGFSFARLRDVLFSFSRQE